MPTITYYGKANAKDIIDFMVVQRNEEQREILMKFFKTGPGDYGHGDDFLGLKVPETREVVKAFSADISLNEVEKLLASRWHEVRLAGLLAMVAKFGKLATKRLGNDEEAIKKRDEIITTYLTHADRANNWDLVDLSAQQGDPSWCLRYAEFHLHHPHDLMHKAVGWMLREMGKRVSMDLLRDFLRQHIHEMPRTTLRYAIEKMDEKERKEWMEKDG